MSCYILAFHCSIIVFYSMSSPSLIFHAISIIESTSFLRILQLAVSSLHSYHHTMHLDVRYLSMHALSFMLHCLTNTFLKIVPKWQLHDLPWDAMLLHFMSLPEHLCILLYLLLGSSQYHFVYASVNPVHALLVATQYPLFVAWLHDFSSFHTIVINPCFQHPIRHSMHTLHLKTFTFMYSYAH